MFKQSLLSRSWQSPHRRTYAKALSLRRVCVDVYPSGWLFGLTVGVLSGTAAFSVKKRRLFERSEFLRFS
ncbi:MAG: hypothetical protein E7098_04275 [Mediterranea massiliensis]|nr:hypothetical protein [Mediterranea massiliensis]